MKYKNYLIGPKSIWLLAAFLETRFECGRKHFEESNFKLPNISIGRMKGSQGPVP